ncbi:ParB/RepB/Spo0J family partition protein [Membranicola marinus]|uniref:ParB/RepB/Spo0J family partition protein n=1 Tax=Membranihabitans marinus TaxID=1227546 RepID=A0A953I0C8_9BACT|nr:ParB/RepB/Spo0J family partition protein [Membranihabitans marinus]MBY5960061.1 ParB/RepB/Spo0J family partition protein [Membranihabitans marinus]
MAKIKKKELGKGLQALLSNMDEEREISLPIKAEGEGVDSDQLLFQIPLEKIEANPDQPRNQFDDEALEELSQSIRTHGIIQPITIRKLHKDKYQIISGERRFRAAELAGLEAIPAYVRIANDIELLEMALVENIQREDLNPLEISISYQRLIDECNITHEELSNRIGKNRSTITNYIRLLKLPPEVQKGVKEKKLSMGHARALLSLTKIDECLYVYSQILNKGLSVRATERLIRDLHTSKNRQEEKSEDRDPEIQRIEGRLTETLGANVMITSRDGMKGEIKIKFETPNHLEEILEVIDQDSF